MKQDFAKAVAEVFAEEILRHRAVRKEGLSRLAVTFAVAREDGWESATALIADNADVVIGDIRPPGMPWLRVAASEDALRTLFGGRGDATSLALLGEVRVEGDVFLLNDVAACFGPGESALSVRLRR